MNNRSGLSFADVLILVALVLLLAALAIPKFVKAPDYGNEEDEAVAEATNQVSAADTPDTEKGSGPTPVESGTKNRLINP